MRKIVALSFILLIAQSSYGLQFSEKILTKNGQEYQVRVTQVQKWGLLLDDERTILYKVISKIETTDKRFVNKVQNIFPDIKIAFSDSIYLLDFNDLIIPRLVKREFKYFDNFSVQSIFMVKKQDESSFYSVIIPKY